MKNSQAVYTDRILRHYITLALREAGVRVDSDIHAELDGASVATAIDQAIAPLAQRIADMEKRIAELEEELAEAEYQLTPAGRAAW